jgi:hypothetical protein
MHRDAKRSLLGEGYLLTPISVRQFVTVAPARTWIPCAVSAATICSVAPVNAANIGGCHDSFKNANSIVSEKDA